jgi:hypothetical protein
VGVPHGCQVRGVRLHMRAPPRTEARLMNVLGIDLPDLTDDFLVTGVLMIVWGLDSDGDPALAMRASTTDRIQVLGALDALRDRALVDTRDMWGEPS